MSIQQFKDRVRGRDLTNEQSISQYCTWIERFFTWHDGGPITASTLIDFDTALEHPEPLAWDRDEPYAYSTRRFAICAVGLWAQRMEDQTFDDDLPDLVRGEEDPFDPTILSQEEIERVLSEDCSYTGCQAARHVGYDAIMRAEEIARMEPEDVDVAGQKVYVRTAKGDKSQWRWVPVDGETTAHLESHLETVTRSFDDPDKLFYNAYGNGLSANAWSQHFRESHHPAGFHAFARHSAITHQIQAEGFGATYIRARHSLPKTTARYCNIADVKVPEWVG